MRRSRALFIHALVAAACSTFAAPGLAAPDGAGVTAERSAQAEALFQQGLSFIDAGDVASGCAKLEESQRLEPRVGTEFRLADCYERMGRTASAWAGFVDVQGKVNTPEEVSKAEARARALEPRLCRARIVVPTSVAALDGLQVERDGVVVGRGAWNTPAPVDPGKHVFSVRANGRVPWTTTVEVRDAGVTVDVKVPALESSGSGVDTELSHPQRVTALFVGGVGLVGLGAGAALAGLAAAAWSDAQDLCPSRAHCSTTAHDESASALSLSHASTGTFVAGGVGAAIAVVLWFTTPSEAPREGTAKPRARLAPWVDPTSAGITLELPL